MEIVHGGCDTNIILTLSNPRSGIIVKEANPGTSINLLRLIKKKSTFPNPHNQLLLYVSYNTQYTK